MVCEQCGEGYDPVACKWRCPLCGWKASCCEGEPAEVLKTIVGEETIVYPK